MTKNIITINITFDSINQDIIDELLDKLFYYERMGKINFHYEQTKIPPK